MAGDWRGFGVHCSTLVAGWLALLFAWIAIWDGLIGGLPKDPPAADDNYWCCLGVCDAWAWRWEMGILAEGGGPGYGILAFAYGDLKIQAFCENCGFGLIACGGVGLPFWGIAWLGRLGGIALGLGDAFCRRIGFWDWGQRDGWRGPGGSVRLSVRQILRCALNDDRLRVGHEALRF